MVSVLALVAFVRIASTTMKHCECCRNVRRVMYRCNFRRDVHPITYMLCHECYTDHYQRDYIIVDILLLMY
jgi:hypothetical protein